MPSPQSAHDAARAAAEGVRQRAHEVAVTDAQHKAADAAYRQVMVTAGRTHGVKNGAAQAMIQRGEVPTSGGWQAGDV